MIILQNLKDETKFIGEIKQHIKGAVASPKTYLGISKYPCSQLVTALWSQWIQTTSSFGLVNDGLCILVRQLAQWLADSLHTMCGYGLNEGNLVKDTVALFRRCTKQMSSF